MIDTHIRPWNIIKICKSKLFIFQWVWDKFLQCRVLELVRWQRIHFIKRIKIKTMLGPVLGIGIIVGLIINMITTNNWSFNSFLLGFMICELLKYFKVC